MAPSRPIQTFSSEQPSGLLILDLLRAISEKPELTRRAYIESLHDLTTAISQCIRGLGLVHKVEHEPVKYWSSVRGRRLGFIDGGITSIRSLGGITVAVRVGEYSVVPGDLGASRESKSTFIAHVGDLFERTTDVANEAFFEVDGRVANVLVDIARIVVETAAAAKLAKDQLASSLTFLHGPLISPIFAFEARNLPLFSNKGLALALPEHARHASEMSREILDVHLLQLALLQEAKVPVAGIVERSNGSSLVTRTLLRNLRDSGKMPRDEANRLLSLVDDLAVNDALVWQCVLQEHEYAEPLQLRRSEALPPVNAFFVKPQRLARPLRIEMFNSAIPSLDVIASYVVHSSRLSGPYCLPNGITVADSLARVPTWVRPSISRAEDAMTIRSAISLCRDEIVAEFFRGLIGNERLPYLRPRTSRKVS